MFATESGIDPPQPDRGYGEDLADHPNRLLDSGIPVGHHRGHPDESRLLNRHQLLAEAVGMDPVPIVVPGHTGIGQRFANAHPRVLTGTVTPMDGGDDFGMLRSEGIVAVETINQGHSATAFPQQRTQQQQPEGLGPVIVSGKVGDPGIDQEDKGCLGHNRHHQKTLPGCRT